MANITPVQLFPSYSSDGTNITIPISSLPALTSVEADAGSGDGREVLRALLEAAFSNYTALDDANKPTKLLISKTNPTAIGATELRQTISARFDFNFDTTGVTMSAES